MSTYSGGSFDCDLTLDMTKFWINIFLSVWVGQVLHGHGVGQHGGWTHFLKPCFHEDKATKSINNPH